MTHGDADTGTDVVVNISDDPVLRDEFSNYKTLADRTFNGVPHCFGHGTYSGTFFLVLACIFPPDHPPTPKTLTEPQRYRFPLVAR